MSKTVEQLNDELDTKIPRDVISERDGGGGRKLSYLEGFYVIDRLNKVFGNLNWHNEITDVRAITNKTAKGEFPAYLVKVRLAIRGADGTLTIKEGYGYGSDKSTQNSHELAMKEAVTDALKVAAKNLGMSMGLALYDKTQENVDDGETKGEVEVKPERRDSPVRVSLPKAQTEDKPPALSVNRGAAETGPAAEGKILELVQRYIKVARAQKKSDQTKAYFSKVGVESADDINKLTEEQLTAAKTFLEELTK